MAERSKREDDSMQRVSTLEEAMTLVPTHWLLVPNVDRWREGDEILEVGNIGQGREVFWDLVRGCLISCPLSIVGLRNL